MVIALVRFLYVSPIFFFIVTSPTDIYTLSLHDALPIFLAFVDADNEIVPSWGLAVLESLAREGIGAAGAQDRKSTRLNSSHVAISYAVFCLKKKTNLGMAVLLSAWEGWVRLRHVKSSLV